MVLILFLVFLPCVLVVSFSAPDVCLNQIDNNDTCHTLSSDGESLMNTDYTETTTAATPTSPATTCTLFLAESTIPHAGLGLFTGVDRPRNQAIGYSDVVLPLIDHWYHLQKHQHASRFDMTADYVWNGIEVGLGSETAFPEQSFAFSPGLDAAINCHFAIHNVDKTYPEQDFTYHRSIHPTAGAISPYINQSTFAATEIPAGSELFKSYGEDWFLSRKSMEAIPLSADFEKAATLLRLFLENFENQTMLDEAVTRDIFVLLKKSPLLTRQVKTVLGFIEYTQLATFRLHGFPGIFQPTVTRTYDDLARHGLCVDGLRPGPSTIPDAGRGAFATRLFVNNSVVTGTPLLFTPSTDLFVMYRGDWLTQESPPLNEIAGYQLLLNYCWRPRTSEFYLCPYGYQVNYINHNSKSNVRLQWSQHGVMQHNATLLELSPREIMEQARSSSIGLFLEIVATRDILPGEELFLDYGSEWEAAWSRHVHDFHERNNQNQLERDYISAREWNALHARDILYTNEEEKQTNYSLYPSNLRLRCLLEIYDSEFDVNEADEYWTFENIGVDCIIIERKQLNDTQHPNATFLYRAASELHIPIHDKDNEYVTEWWESEWMPRSVFRMMDRPYTSDLFLPHAFRHAMILPEELVPEVWKNYHYNDNIDNEL